jgi:glutamine synthetase
LSANGRDDIRRLVEENDVNFIRLQFTDISGTLKNVAITKSQLEKALDNECVFDGSSLDGFAREAESDMCLHPDRDTFTMLPWRPSHYGVARLICDVYSPDGSPFEGDPRQILKKQVERAAALGYEFNVGPECEFFLFQTDDNGLPTTTTHDTAGYFDLGTVDMGGDIRREICLTLESMGFELEASHHEAAFGQHEIDFQYDTALRTADNIMTFKMAVKSIAKASGAYATFMPKPKAGTSSSGMHINMSLTDGKKNLFADPDDPAGHGLSETAYRFMAGVLKHARALTAVCNPTVNSYKRLIAGDEAPAWITWSYCSRSPLIRVPSTRGRGPRLELRSPDPAANPYLMLACCLAAGLDGVEHGLTPPPAVNENVHEMGSAERNRRGIGMLPLSLKEAVEELKRDRVVSGVLGEHALRSFLLEKESEWNGYNRSVTSWEIDNYLEKY